MRPWSDLKRLAARTDPLALVIITAAAVHFGAVPFLDYLDAAIGVVHDAAGY